MSTRSNCYPINLDAQRAWHARQMVGPPGHPAPQVGARLASPEEIHRAVRTVGNLRTRARALGWQCNVTYARGWTLPSGAALGSKLIESLALRLRYPGPDEPGWRIGAVMCYRASPVSAPYKFDTGWVWLPPNFPLKCNASEMKYVLTLATERPARDDEAWIWLVDRLYAYRAAEKAKHAEATKKRMATKAGKVVEVRAQHPDTLPLFELEAAA